jgi:tetratricopeptide (TPR) repeat protein
MISKNYKKVLILLLLTAGIVNVSSAQAKDLEHEWRITKDPFYGDALYHYTRQHYFSAITRLLAGKRLGRLGSHKEEAELLLGGMYLSYGMHNKATKTFDLLLDKKSVKQKIRDRARFYLGKIRYQRGYLDKAEKSLLSVGKALPDNLQEEHAVILSNILMSKGNYKKAVSVLENVDRETAWSVYGKYNLGIALIRLGQQKRGISLLESVGDMSAKTDEMKALRDKANTALGYNFIKENKPDEALSFLNDVRLDGLLANKALLGTGWAYSAKKNFRKALVYWTESCSLFISQFGCRRAGEKALS